MSGSGDQVEIEQKYDAGPEFTLPDLSGLPGVATVSEPRIHQLVAAYYDTADFRLAAHGITLRRRRGGDDAGWHLKIPVGPDSRNELHAPLGRGRSVPARLASLVAVHTRGVPVRQVAQLETRRTVVHLLDKAGTVLAEVADDAVSGQVGDPVVDDTTVTTWREIEVELVDGSPKLLKPAAKALKQAGARRASSKSKLGRLLSGAGVLPNDDAPDSGAEPGSAGAAVVDYLAGQIARLQSYDPKARLAEPDAVHKMRVASRRIRSALRGYRAVLDRTRTDDLRDELKWLGEVLGEVRDLEVLRMRFTDLVDDLRGTAPDDTPHDGTARNGTMRTGTARIGSTRHDDAGGAGAEARTGGSSQAVLGESAAVDRLLTQLREAETAAYKRMNAALNQQRYFTLLDALDALVAHPPFTGRAGRRGARELPRLVERAWRRLVRKYEAIATADDTDTARHDTRKAAKQARYAADLAASALKSSGDKAEAGAASRVAAEAKELQEVLGGYQDGVIAMERLREACAAADSTRDGFDLGVLAGAELITARRSLDRLESTWEKLRGPRF